VEYHTLGMRFRYAVVALGLVACVSPSSRGEGARSTSLPSAVIKALSADEKVYCDQFGGDFKKGCHQTFRANLSWRELKISPSGETAILVKNGESCGTAGCALGLFVQQTDGPFVQVLGTDGEVGTLSSVEVLKTVTKNHYDIQKTWHDRKTQTLYQWDGARYRELITKARANLTSAVERNGKILPRKSRESIQSPHKSQHSEEVKSQS
jgi:hypothetical protein